MMKMIYKKNPNSDPETVMMINAYRGHDGKLKAIIMRDYDISQNVENMPYEEVKLNKLRPFPDDFNRIFRS